LQLYEGFQNIFEVTARKLVFDMKKGFRFLEHTADAYVEAYGSSLEEAFENAALASTEVMTDVEKVEARDEEKFVVEAPDEPALLYSWLEELLLEFELKRKLYSRFEVSGIEETAKGFRLRARAWGEKYDPEKHPSKVAVKAVTYHRMEIVKKPESVTVRFILDI
jgi:SHS2 domain-containing protein